jgi:hypothetical protein
MKAKNYLANGMAPRKTKSYRVWATIISFSLAIIFAVVSAGAQAQAPFSFNLVPASNAIGACLPNATAEVTVFPREETLGVDTLDLKAQGLKSDTTFAVFLTELPVAPFGAVQYVGDFTTNAAGRGSLRVDTIVDEAFSSQVVAGQRVRKELNHVVLWFADPAADESCIPGSGQSPFDGDGVAGVAALSSKNLLPGTPLP